MTEPRRLHDIVLVEDDPGQARLTQRVLERAGYTVSWVGSASECQARIAAQPPDMVLLDRGLPDGDGVEVLRRIRRDAPRVCVIMLTGADDITVAVEALRLGAWDYVLKRPDLSHLADLPLVLERNCERLSLTREREQLHEAVRQSEQRYHELFDHASDLIVVCTPTGMVQEANHAFVELTGQAIEDVCGRPLSDFVLPSSPCSADALCARTSRGVASTTAELHLRARDGRDVCVDMRTRPLLSSNGARGFQAIGRDVTERRCVEQLKADFLAMVTHDMKNPIAVIVGYAEILLNDGCPGAACRDMLLSIDGSARGLLHLILNFLDLSRIEAGALGRIRVPTCIDEVLQQVIDHAAPLARAKGIELVPELHAGVEIATDPTQMDRVFVNLIGNAIKFTPPGGCVRIHSAPRDGGVEVRVSDTGPGIPRDQISHLFGRYQRLSQTAQTDGTGLGLFIAKSMIEAHNGSVHVESPLGQGATFIVHLPQAQ